ncbi:winged helix-turn-helix domain-containing protein [Duganella fentianensis]|uniref:nSTAND1 domain-containing NTPase n=1 Tax=Duganella fentianensis TaxID=2692177 RepID=UPI0032B1CD64
MNKKDSETQSRRLRNFQFGAWKVEPRSNSLLRGEERQTLEPRAMEVLLFICKQNGAVVSIDAILEACWGSSLSGDNPVHKTIAQLRRALGDDSKTPSYIETIRKRGYRAVAEVVEEHAAASGAWMASSPFRGLQAFEEQHAGIFFGRQRVTSQLQQTLQSQLATGCAMLLVLGPSGSGKTSLIRAGLLPRLMSGAGGTPPLIRAHLMLDCADLTQLSALHGLASLLLDGETADQQPWFPDQSAATLAQRLTDDLDGVIAQLVAHAAGQRTALFIDRFEALFRQPHIHPAERQQLLIILDRLARCGAIIVLLTCRNDFYPALVASPQLMALKEQGGHFDLLPPSVTELGDIIRQPARAAQLQFERADSGTQLDDVLCDAAASSPDTLPLLQYCLHELYRQRSADGLLRFEVFQALGGLEGALGRRAEQLIVELSAAQVAALPHVLSQLVQIDEDDMAVTSRHVPWSALHTPAERELVQELVDARLLVSDLSGGMPAFAVAHEALLRRWPRVTAWIEQHRLALQTRSRVRQQAQRWQSNSRSRDLLLPSGLQLDQASDLLAIAGFVLTPLEREYIDASRYRVTVRERIRIAVFSGVLALALLAAVLGLLARNAQQQAERARSEAEGLMGFMLGEFVDKLRPLGRLDLLDTVSARALGYLSSEQGRTLSASDLAFRAKALQVISEVDIARADSASAEKALTLAHAILQQQRTSDPANRALIKDQGSNAFWLGQIQLDRKDYPAATRHFTEYLQLSDQLAALAPDDVDAWMEQSYAHSNLGTVALKQGDIERAAAEFAHSVALKTRVQASRPKDQKIVMDLANSVSWQASASSKLGQLDTALQLHERELALLQQLHDSVPSNAVWSNRLALAYTHRGEIRQALGQQAAAHGDFSAARSLLQAIMRQDTSNRDWQQDLCSIELRWLDTHPAGISTAQQAASLKSLEERLRALAKLEPRKGSLQRLIAVVQQRMAQLHGNERTQAATLLEQAGQTLQAQLTRSPKDQAMRISLADNLLLQAGLAASGRDAASAYCSAAQDLLRDAVRNTQDFRLLTPWVKIHHCLGNPAGASAEQTRLEAMQFRDPAYLGYIASHTH